jgi:hypothetical protein
MAVTFFEHRQRLLAVLYLVLIPAAILAVAIGGLVRTARLAEQGNEAHRAICTLRDDLQRRVNDTRGFLATHPNGFAGVDRPTILNSLANQERTIDALRTIHCDKERSR